MNYKCMGLALGLLVLSVTQAYAVDGCRVDMESNTTKIYFSNGILVDDPDDVAYELSKAYKDNLVSLYPGQIFQFAAANNYTQGVVADVLQVLEQKLDEGSIAADELSAYQLIQWLNAGLNSEQVREAVASLSYLSDPTSVQAKLTDQFIQNFGQTLSDKLAEAHQDKQVVNQQHVQIYESDLLAGRRVIVVAHSQGNLFANNAVQQVMNRQPQAADSIRIIGIATPAAVAVGDNEYITAHDDRVIDALRLISDVLPSNLDNDPGIFNDDRSFTNHLLLTDYFPSALASRLWIDERLFALAASMPFPFEEVGDGAIRATLTWGSQPDVDLHVFEPDGTHVYYANLDGSSGFLDLDDITGYGPENYFVACGDVVEGTYQIAVNYYSGSLPEMANVQLTLGDGSIPPARQVYLAQSFGSAGNSTPILVWEIDVEIDELGWVSYTVY